MTQDTQPNLDPEHLRANNPVLFRLLNLEKQGKSIDNCLHREKEPGVYEFHFECTREPERKIQSALVRCSEVDAQRMQKEIDAYLTEKARKLAEAEGLFIIALGPLL